MLRLGASGWYCGDSVSMCLTGWDGLRVMGLVELVMGREEHRVVILCVLHLQHHSSAISMPRRVHCTARMSSLVDNTPPPPPPAHSDVGKLRRCLIAAVTLFWKWCQVAEVHWSFLKHKTSLKRPVSEAADSRLWSKSPRGVCVSVLPHVWEDTFSHQNIISYFPSVCDGIIVEKNFFIAETWLENCVMTFCCLTVASTAHTITLVHYRLVYLLAL